MNLTRSDCVMQVGPQAIWVVNRDLGDSSSAHSSDLEDAEDIDDAASWETVISDDDDGRGVQVFILLVVRALACAKD